MGSRWRKLALALLTMVALGLVLLAALPQGRTGVRSALFVTQVVPAIPLEVQSWVTPEPIMERKMFPTPDGDGIIDIYRPPGDGPHSAILLFPGVAPAGEDDPRVSNLGEALARSGSVAMFYWSPVELNLRISADDVDRLVQLFKEMRQLPYVDPDKVGMAGFSVGASIGMVAASRDEIRHDVTFFNAFGPYFDLRDLMIALSSETRFYHGETRLWQDIDWLSHEVFALQLVESLETAEERGLLRRRFVEDEPVEIDQGELSPEARAAYRLLDGLSVDKAREATWQLPESLHEKIVKVSPRYHVHCMEARLLIMHDREDRHIPAEESRRLVDALEERGDVYYTEFSFFDHVTPGETVSPPELVVEAGKLFLHMYNILWELR